MDKVVASPAAKKPGALDKVIGTAKAVVKSEIKGFKDFGSGVARMADNPVAAGQDLATPIVTQLPSVKAARSQAEAAAQQEQAARAALVAKRNQIQAAGGDTSALNSVITNNTPAIPLSGTLNDAENKTRLQVAGDFAGTAADVLSAGQIGADGKTVSQVLKGAGTGYAADLSNHLKSGDTGINALTPGMGTVIGATIPFVEPAISSAGKGMSAVTKAAKQSKTALDTVSTARGSVAHTNFVKDLVTPELTGKNLANAIKTGKVTEGVGVGARDVSGAVPGLKSIVEEVSTVPGLSKNKTLLENTNAIHDEVGAVAENLVTSLKTVEQQVGKDRGFFTPNEFKGYMKGVKTELQDNPLLVGDAEKTGNKILAKFEALVKQHGYTPSGLLSARKELDSWMKMQKGNVFDGATENAVSIALRAIRQGGNDFLAAKVPDVAVKEMLARQSNLYRAIDNLAPKAAKEGATGFERFIGRHSKAIKVGSTIIGGGTVIGAGKSLLGL
jgi:hypothetical protein